MTRITIAVFAAIVVGGAQDKTISIDFPAPATVVGHLDDTDDKLPAWIDKNAGAMDVYRFSVSKPTNVYARAECDACDLRLALTADALNAKLQAKGRGYSATLDKELQPGRYLLYVGSGYPGEMSAYTLRLNDLPLPQQIKMFYQGINGHWLDGSREVNELITIRLGIEEMSISQSVGTHTYLTFKYSDITAVESSAQTTDHRATGMLFGPAFGGSSSQSFITVKTAEDFVVLDIPPSRLPLILAAIQQATKK